MRSVLHKNTWKNTEEIQLWKILYFWCSWQYTRIHEKYQKIHGHVLFVPPRPAPPDPGVFVRISMYFHSYCTCGARVNIGWRILAYSLCIVTYFSHTSVVYMTHKNTVYFMRIFMYFFRSWSRDNDQEQRWPALGGRQKYFSKYLKIPHKYAYFSTVTKYGKYSKKYLEIREIRFWWSTWKLQKKYDKNTQTILQNTCICTNTQKYAKIR